MMDVLKLALEPGKEKPAAGKAPKKAAATKNVKPAAKARQKKPATLRKPDSKKK